MEAAPLALSLALFALLLPQGAAAPRTRPAGVQLGSTPGPNVLIVYYNGANDDTDLLAQAIEEGATAANATVKSIEVAAANYERDVRDWADAVVLGSGVYNGNAGPEMLAFINTFNFMDTDILSDKVGASFASGGGAASGIQPVLESLNRGLLMFNFVVTGGGSWQNAEGTGATFDAPPGSTGNLTDADRKLAQLEGNRVARLAARLKAPSPPPPPVGGGPPGWGSLWKAKVSANLTQVGYDAGLVIVNFSSSCDASPRQQKMKTVYGDFYTVLTRCDLGMEFTIAPLSRGGNCTARHIGRDVSARICAACGCPFCVRDTAGTYTHGESLGSSTVWGAVEVRTVQGLEVDVWAGVSASSSAAQSAPGATDTFNLKTVVAFLKDGSTPAFVNVSHPLWVQTAAAVSDYTTDVPSNEFDIPDKC